MLLENIFASVFLEEHLEAVTSGACGPEHLVRIQIFVIQIDDAAGDTGAVIAGSFQSVDQVSPDKTGLDAAAALLKSKDVSGAKLILQFVDYLLQRFNGSC